MGPKTKRGIGGGGYSTAPPNSPDSGSGGPGALLGGLNAAPAAGELADVTSGRITLALIDAAVIVLILFYMHTRAQQGGS